MGGAQSLCPWNSLGGRPWRSYQRIDMDLDRHMLGKASPEKYRPKFYVLCIFYSAIAHRCADVQAIVVALYVLPFLVFSIAEICPHTSNSEIVAPAVKGRNTVIPPRYQPPVFIKGGLHGKLVMLKCEIGFRCAIVGVFRADMFECCQQRHPLSARLQTLGQQGRKPPPVPPRQAAGRGCATRSASGLSGLSCRRSCRTRL